MGISGYLHSYLIPFYKSDDVIHHIKPGHACVVLYHLFSVQNRTELDYLYLGFFFFCFLFCFKCFSLRVKKNNLNIMKECRQDGYDTSLKAHACFFNTVLLFFRWIL